ncbi:TetR/AcrR family transcriptional regulator [Brachybacterium huguangmaarense]|uniref:TetR/AcrR family transcriptional regulator n=1 Tax=Brachybacterium huguangmaarense TaxID=1652028 RepID=A0ABY6G2I1_9MICO|nr:TetR/AcrR family transcriptional regulator [Brachybacterium huguangmaarense]UYG17327.1 TetR/AcrR family transcriptional regulator [Brachybacterium huguangmaarense]
MPRTDPRGGARTRARILEASSPLFLEHGFDAVTVAQIAKEAGVSSVTVFNHFPRKEDMFLDRAFDADELLRAAVRDRAPGRDVLDALEELCARLADERHALSGLDPRSVPFFRTVAGSAAVIARARQIAADLAAALAEEITQTSASPSTAARGVAAPGDTAPSDTAPGDTAQNDPRPGGTGPGNTQPSGVAPEGEEAPAPSGAAAASPTTTTTTSPSGDGTTAEAELLAALFVAGYAAVLTGTARRRLRDAPTDEVDPALVEDHRVRLGALFTMLRSGAPAHHG